MHILKLFICNIYNLLMWPWSDIQEDVKGFAS